MTDLNILKNTLAVVIDADKQLLGGMPLYQVKGLFDGLVLAEVIDFDTQYGELLKVFIDTKRKDTAMQNLIYVRSLIQTLIKEGEEQQELLVESEKEQDDLAIESTCEVVTVSRNDKEVQLQLGNIPKKLGRPATGKALTNAERSKRAREKKKANKLVTINQTLTKHGSVLYNDLINNGHDINSILSIAHNHYESYAKHGA